MPYFPLPLGLRFYLTVALFATILYCICRFLMQGCRSSKEQVYSYIYRIRSSINYLGFGTTALSQKTIPAT